MANYTGSATLLPLVDDPTRNQLVRDMESGYLRWSYGQEGDDAALVTAEDRVAVILYFPAAGEPYGDFEMADWYYERVTG